MKDSALLLALSIFRIQRPHLKDRLPARNENNGEGHKQPFTLKAPNLPQDNLPLLEDRPE